MVTARFLDCLPWVVLVAASDCAALAVVIVVGLWLRRKGAAS